MDQLFQTQCCLTHLTNLCVLNSQLWYSGPYPVSDVIKTETLRLKLLSPGWYTGLSLVKSRQFNQLLKVGDVNTWWTGSDKAPNRDCGFQPGTSRTQILLRTSSAPWHLTHLGRQVLAIE